MAERKLRHGCAKMTLVEILTHTTHNLRARREATSYSDRVRMSFEEEFLRRDKKTLQQRVSPEQDLIVVDTHWNSTEQVPSMNRLDLCISGPS